MPYVEAGFQINLISRLSYWGSWCAESENFAGSALFIGNLAGATLSAVDKSPFGISSIDLANLFAGAVPFGPMTFTGHLANGGLVSQTLNFVSAGTSPPVFSTFTFGAGFENLTSLDLPEQPLSASRGYQFTNVRLNPTSVTPEPASWLLAATGLAMLAVGARRWRRRGGGPSPHQT